MAKICLVTHFFPPHIGGIEKVADEQSKRLAKLGYQVSVLTSKTHKKNERHAEGIKVFSYSILNIAERVGIPYPVLSFKAYKNFAEVIKKCDIVHAHGHAYMSSYIACEVAKKYKKPFILTQHNTFIDYQSWLNIVEHVNDWTVGRVVLKGSDRVITVSRKTMEYVLKLGADISKTSVMHNGVNTTFFHPMNREESRDKLGLPKNRTLILTIRRLVYKNGLDTFIESAPLLTRDYPDLLFIVIGTGPSRKLIEKRVRELGIEDNVRLTGFVPEKLLPLYYNAADYFVIPSSSGEGLPLVLLEAMACGLPVIATSVGGTPEIVEDMRNGVLVPPRNPKALAKTISKFLSNRELGPAIGEEARKTVEDEFTWEENVRRLRSVYDEFL
ncbi:MAG: glycosyltransferase family 4 protein [Candidatus Bathyarchaeota archaeon]|nr:glycosyltransferase family 4 protein [Candidatus Bathyarchaeota archaeon]